jgi:acyl carrier protein
MARRKTMVDLSSGPVSFDEFRKMLAEVLLIEEERIIPEASFVTDLFVDSLRWVEMALSIEQLGVEMPSEAFWEIQTVGDAYNTYMGHFVTGS